LRLAIPHQLHTAEASIDSYPQKFLGSYNRVKAAFPGVDAGPVVIKAPDVEASAVQRRSASSQRVRWPPVS
jgi:hypothetical protein